MADVASNVEVSESFVSNEVVGGGPVEDVYPQWEVNDVRSSLVEFENEYPNPSPIVSKEVVVRGLVEESLPQEVGRRSRG